MSTRVLGVLRVSAVVLFLFSSLAAQDRARSEYYKKWLDEDVLWIITEEETAVFDKLTTDEERDLFIEQFWLRRDPDPDTQENEYKQEHYRRILYANEHFSAGIEGYRTDRGMIYIKFGPPDRKETYPAGGMYTRERKEGGGFTSIFPMERWEYRRIEGAGDDIELEFVDDKGGGLFELTWDKQRKDALLLSGLQGLTQDEEEQEQMTGSTNKRDRVARRRISGEWRGIYSGMGGFETAKDRPFEQLNLSGSLNRPPAIKYKDLEVAVSTRVTYNQFPFDTRADYIRLTPQQVLVPVTLLLANRNLTFKQELGLYHGRAQIFGRVTSLAGRVLTVFEDEVAREFPPGELEQMKARSSVYQKRLILRPGIYKLEVAIQDVESGRMGTLEQRLQVPQFDREQLTVSSLILADRIEAGVADRTTDSFILGDLKVVAKADDVYKSSDHIGLYFQVYNFAVDQQTHRPGLKAEYAIAPQGGEAMAWRDMSSLVQYAGQYCRLARMVTLDRLKPGNYELRVRIHDSISNQTTKTAAPFRITS